MTWETKSVNRRSGLTRPSRSECQVGFAHLVLYVVVEALGDPRGRVICGGSASSPARTTHRKSTDLVEVSRNDWSAKSVLE